MVVIPHIVTQSEKSKVTLQQICVGLGVAGGLIVLVVIFSYVVMPLDVFVSMVMMRLGLY